LRGAAAASAANKEKQSAAQSRWHEHLRDMVDSFAFGKKLQATGRMAGSIPLQAKDRLICYSLSLWIPDCRISKWKSDA
jgi:hypothetical protein